MKLHPFLFRCHQLLVCATIIVVGYTSTSRAQDIDAFGKVRTFLDTSVKDGIVAGGSVLVFHNGEIVFQTGFGFADINSETPFGVDTPVVIASVSKPIIGTTLFRLADSGTVDVSAPVTDYLPVFSDRKLVSGAALNRPPTVNELLTHSSGLRHDDAKGGRVWFQDWSSNKTLEDVVNKVAMEFPFVTQPGTRFAYSGTGTDVAARVGEVVTKLSRNEMLQRYLCEPLEMENTFYRDAAGLKRLKLPMPSRYYRDKETGKLLEDWMRPVPRADQYSASGGTIVSTAPDLLRWLLMIRNGGIHGNTVYLTKECHLRMLEEYKFGSIAAGGLFVRARDGSNRPVTFGHTGSSGTNVWIDFETDTIGIMLTQTRGSDIKPFRIELERQIMEAISH